MNSTNTFMHIRKAILIGSKVIGIIFCLYYISQAKNYSISWSLFDWLIPSYIATINQLLSKVGTYILILPLTMIILSLLIPESTALHILSSFFGVSSILFSTMRNLYNNSLTEATNFKLFTVSHVLSLQDKRDIFITEYKLLAKDCYLHVIKTYNYLMEQVNSESFIIHDKILHDLNLPSQIKQYAQAIVTETVTYYAQYSQASTLTLPSLKTVLICITVILAIMGAMAVANKLVVDYTALHEKAIDGHSLATQALQKISAINNVLIDAGLCTNEGVSKSSNVLANLNINIDRLYRLFSYIRDHTTAIDNKADIDKLMPTIIEQ